MAKPNPPWNEITWVGLAMKFVAAVQSVAVSYQSIAKSQALIAAAITKLGPTKIRMLFGSPNTKKPEEK